MSAIKKLSLENFGPIKHADVQFGDLTVLVGPQATGKSIFLQTLKLVADRDSIHDTFSQNNVEFKGDPKAFLDGYFGNGMASVWTDKSKLRVNGKDVSLTVYTKPSKSASRDESLFFIPAQRVMSLRDGQTQTFGAFRFGDPYILRAFSDSVHQLLQNEFGAKPGLFPQKNRLTAALRKPIAEHLFGGASLEVDDKDYTKRLVLNVPGAGTGLPYLAWSAGQREFTPLLLGIYWLCPPASTPQREGLKYVVIEELEMGLHPQGINTVLLLVLELLARNYKVVLSTHSPHVLDMVWALQVFKQAKGTEADVRKLFDLPAAGDGKALAQSALSKNYRVYYFKRDGTVQDISSLDPGADSADESGWGGLSEFSGKVGEAVAEVVNRKPAKRVRRAKVPA
ncbi:MAG: AAA family ATPase [Sulfuritalea sp.]|jgi:energy-coupling factor transporter ATP-binding protein EcfA2|nr:AAA family ATPase [Sulfuritalea sp.]MDP1982267.1 AAA family ATPase [Sulfuritalea sp.]